MDVEILYIKDLALPDLLPSSNVKIGSEESWQHGPYPRVYRGEWEADHIYTGRQAGALTALKLREYRNGLKAIDTIKCSSRVTENQVQYICP